MKKIALIFIIILAGCRERTIGPSLPWGWTPLVIGDPNDSWNGDIKEVYARYSDGIVEFMIVTYEHWNTKEDVEFGIFLDTDQNSNTGLTSSQPNWNYTVNDIGADYVISVGFESASDSLLQWSDDKWNNSMPLYSISMPEPGDTMICGINVEDIGDPPIIDLIVIEASKEGEFDYCPNSGHVTFTLEE